MGYSVKVVEDSISEAGNRITTFQLSYPRFVHAEFMTHRVFSRNASSSRAIPVMKMIEQVREDYAHPIHWGKNQPGMQAKEELDQPQRIRVQSLWYDAAMYACDIAEKMHNEGAHKQIVNRILEPFQYIHVVVTATEYNGFFLLRAHKDAQPEIHYLAYDMMGAWDWHKPKLLMPGEWHLPYVTQDERNDSYFADKPELLRQISAARCARVSYLKHDGTTPNIADDLELYSQLVVRPYTDKRGNVLTLDDPIHASPVEHQATPDFYLGRTGEYLNPHQHGNFVGWIQHRKLIEQNIKQF